MSQSKYQTPYFQWLTNSASPQVKREITQMEQSKQNSFASVGQIIAKRYGQPVTKLSPTANINSPHRYGRMK